MKRKLQVKPEPVVSPEILESAKRSLGTDRGSDRGSDRNNDRSKAPVKCVVCAAETPSGAAEPLCWVCRRLKISAWRDVEQQMPAQE
jgi:hypothetical protein